MGLEFLGLYILGLGLVGWNRFQGFNFNLILFVCSNSSFNLLSMTHILVFTAFKFIVFLFIDEKCLQFIASYVHIKSYLETKELIIFQKFKERYVTSVLR